MRDAMRRHAFCLFLQAYSSRAPPLKVAGQWGDGLSLFRLVLYRSNESYL